MALQTFLLYSAQTGAEFTHGAGESVSDAIERFAKKLGHESAAAMWKAGFFEYIEGTPAPGALVKCFRGPLGAHGPDEHYKCPSCETVFPVIAGEVRSNGVGIRLCPWCRTDSQPWMHGRGL